MHLSGVLLYKRYRYANCGGSFYPGSFLNFSKNSLKYKIYFEHSSPPLVSINMSTCLRQHFSCSISCILNYLIQIDGEEASRLSKKHLEREKAHRDAAADFSEDLPDGGKGENINESSIHAES